MQNGLIPLVVLSAYILASCNFPGTVENPEESDRNAVLTAAAETVAAALEQGTVLVESATVAPTNLATIDPTELPAATATLLTSVTNTPMPSNTSIPANTPLPCSMATFVKDVTVPDDTVFGPGATFRKTWRLKNVGTCPWTSGYDLIFDSGDDMSGVAEILLTSSTIEPGQSLDVSVDLKAPSAEGTYRGSWLLRDAGGVVFGLTSGGSFWVQIKVVALNKAVVTLNSIVNEAASVLSDGSVYGELPDVGDTSGNEGSQAFISFDISAIPTDAIITEVKVDFSAYDIQGDPFGSLNCLRMYAQNYQPIDNGDYTAPGAVNALVGWCNSSQLGTITVENHVKDQLQTELGSTRLQFRLQFSDKHHDGDNHTDVVRFSNDNVDFIKLIVSYASP
jgi:hypothetical protein